MQEPNHDSQPSDLVRRRIVALMALVFACGTLLLMVYSANARKSPAAAPPAKPAGAKTATTDEYRVYAGSSAHRADAEEIAAKLKKLKTSIERIVGGTKAGQKDKVYFVLVQTFTEREPAYKLSKQLRDQGFDASVTHIKRKEKNKVDDAKLAAMKDKLTPEQYNICFLKGTEPPGSGKYNKHYEPGEYHCVACDALLFKSNTKFDSGTGWPSFWDGADPDAIAQHVDRAHGMVRTEVTCAKCGAHLGHVFSDGPEPTGQRYCINSLALEFVPQAEAGKAE